MGNVILTIQIMPVSPETDLNKILEEAKKFAEEFKYHFAKSEEVPLAFGLKSLNITISYDEKRGGSDEFEEKLRAIDGVNSVEVIDARRAFG
ncbi:MAG TPA: elongation factor 1-beta [Candidatus Nanoarchaeia archaeon]|nr:elongation factor 1-beta [Candidatus Nanoarchaeia archaeon]